jgi:hypothetical protein
MTGVTSHSDRIRAIVAERFAYHKEHRCRCTKSTEEHTREDVREEMGELDTHEVEVMETALVQAASEYKPPTYEDETVYRKRSKRIRSGS